MNIYKRKILRINDKDILCKEFKDGKTVNFVTGEPVTGELVKYLDNFFYRWRLR